MVLFNYKTEQFEKLFKEALAIQFTFFYDDSVDKEEALGKVQEVIPLYKTKINYNMYNVMYFCSMLSSKPPTNFLLRCRINRYTVCMMSYHTRR